MLIYSELNYINYILILKIRVQAGVNKNKKSLNKRNNRQLKKLVQGSTLQMWKCNKCIKKIVVQDFVLIQIEFGISVRGKSQISLLLTKWSNKTKSKMVMIVLMNLSLNTSMYNYLKKDNVPGPGYYHNESTASSIKT